MRGLVRDALLSLGETEHLARAPEDVETINMEAIMQKLQEAVDCWVAFMRHCRRNLKQNPAHGRGKLRDAVLELRKAKMARRRAA